jgi:zinc/manganese transport system substrate-binding protein
MLFFRIGAVNAAAWERENAARAVSNRSQLSKNPAVRRAGRRGEVSVRTRRHVFFFAAGAAVLAATPAPAKDRIPVVATFSILGDLVKNVGGDGVDVTTLVGPNGDVHVYSPTPADARTLGAAKAVFVNGLGLEGWMTRLIAASGATAPVIVASAGVEPRDMPDWHEASHAVPDPHAWQSVANAKIYVANIRDGLDRADPAGSDVYNANAKSYLAKLDALAQEVRVAIDKIPADRRKVITTHYAFGYFGGAYGLQFIAPENLSTDSEPSAKDVAAIITQIRRDRIPAVFLENISDPRLMRVIAGETGAAIGGTLYSDALSEPNGPAGTYIDMMRHNVREFDKALML